MGFNTRVSCAWVNNRNTSIPVYETTVSSPVHAGGITAGGAQIGAILYQEMYTSRGNSNNVTCVRIKFRDGSGKVRYGYIEPNINHQQPYQWAYDQEPWHYFSSNGSYLTTPAKVGDYFIHTVKKGGVAAVRDRNGAPQFTLSAGYQIATNSSTVGATYDGYVVVYQYRVNSSGRWTNLTNSGYGFVDLTLGVGAMPWDRAIY